MLVSVSELVTLVFYAAVRDDYDGDIVDILDDYQWRNWKLRQGEGRSGSCIVIQLFQS